MSDWIVPIVVGLMGLAGGVYATRGKRATDRGDLADRLVDQVQEERDKATSIATQREMDLARERMLRQQDADYIVALRRQLEDAHVTPLPYPGMTR